MNDKRPVNLDISTIQLPLPAIASITHRVSGIFLVGGVGVLLWMLSMALGSEESFNQMKEWLASPLLKLIIWAVLAGLAYHTAAGVRHLIMDMGIGETLKGGEQGAKILIGVAAVLILLAGVWIW